MCYTLFSMLFDPHKRDLEKTTEKVEAVFFGNTKKKKLIWKQLLLEL